MIAVLDQGRAQTTSYAYDGVGNRAGQTHPNGTTVAYTYDERNRLKTLLHKASAAANAAILLSLSYSVDASGLRTQIAETRPNPTASQPAITRTTDYQYDAVKRLTREQVTGTQSQGRTTVFTYDKVGNRKTEATSGTLSKNQTLTYDNNDRLTRVAGTGGTIDHVYDNAGNLIEKKQGTATLERYTFDAEGRLTAATIGTGASQKVLSYRYDPNGIRRSQHVETATGQARTEYLVDPNQAYAQVLEEYETQAATGAALPASALATTYVYGDDLISQTQLALAGNTTHVYHYDGLGTTRALSAHNLDASGNPVTTGPNPHAAITDRYAYTAFGENDPAGTSGNTAGTTENNYRYTGEQLDPNLGFYYLRARYMDPRQGRFVGMDPWSGDFNDPLSLHKYIFANQVPSALGDPSGESATLIGVGVSAGIGAVMGVASTHLTNVALGRASTVGELAMGAAVGAALGAGGYFCPSCLIPLGLYGVASSGALVADVWTGEGTTMKQKAAAAVLLITSIGGTAAGQRVASNIRQLHGFGLLHDRSVRGISRLLTWAGVNHRLEVYVRNPFYRRGRRYDIVVQVPGTGRYIGVEYKSSMSEYLYPKANQSSADHFVKTQGGEMFGSAAGPYGGASVTGVVRINGGRNLVSTCSAGIDCEE